MTYTARIKPAEDYQKDLDAEKTGKYIVRWAKESDIRLDIPCDEIIFLLEHTITEKNKTSASVKALNNVILTAKMQYSDELAGIKYQGRLVRKQVGIGKKRVDEQNRYLPGAERIGRVVQRWSEEVGQRFEISPDEVIFLLACSMEETEKTTSTAKTLDNLVLTAKMQYSSELASYRQEKEEARRQHEQQAQMSQQRIRLENARKEEEKFYLLQERNKTQRSRLNLLKKIMNSCGGYRPATSVNGDDLDSLEEDGFIRRKKFRRRYVVTERGEVASLEEMPVPEALTLRTIEARTRTHLSNMIF